VRRTCLRTPAWSRPISNRNPKSPVTGSRTITSASATTDLPFQRRSHESGTRVRNEAGRQCDATHGLPVGYPLPAPHAQVPAGTSKITVRPSVSQTCRAIHKGQTAGGARTPPSQGVIERHAPTSAAHITCSAAISGDHGQSARMPRGPINREIPTISTRNNMQTVRPYGQNHVSRHDQ
jgi:hypothetical protein